MRYALLLLLLVIPVGCRAEVPIASSGDPAAVRDAVELAEVPQSTKIQGRDLETADAGVWLIRRPATVEAAPSDGRGAERADGAFAGPSGSVAPSMREPSDSTPPAPSASPSPTTPATGRPMDAPVLDPAAPDEIMDDAMDAGGEREEAARRLADEESAKAKALGEDRSDVDALRDDAGAAAKPGGAVAAPMGPPRPAAGALPNVPALKAGTTDDNEKFDDFVAFLATWSDQDGVADRYRDIDVRDRVFIRVVDRSGRPVPAARVQVIDEAGDEVLWSGTTYGDGRIPFYPHALNAEITQTESAALLVQAFHGAARTQASWSSLEGDLTLTLDADTVLPDEIPLDVCFVLDTTGSMGDEIARIKATLLSVTEKLGGIEREFSLRYGAVLYRDLTDAYITKAHPFTSDIEAFATALQSVVAEGGGDTPESLNQGLAEGVGRLDWRPDAAKVMFLIADAPPHMDYEGDVPYDVSLKAAVDRGIRIHSVAASGLDPFGSLVFRQVAQLTRGKFIFIEYGGSVAKSGAAHGVAGAKKSNNLDDILFEQIQDELGNWGRDPAADVSTVTLGGR